jgi:tetratricopeptide (TPR) repeat protein
MLTVRLLSRLARQTRTWWRGRSPRLLLLGLPALFAAAGLAVLTGLSLLAPAGEAEAHYLEAGKDALKRQDYATAETCYGRLAPRGADRPEVLYGLALTAEARGQVGRAEALMADLAPDGPHGGYAPAHLWRARHALRAPGNPAAARDAAEAHLLNALNGSLEDPAAAYGLLGELYLGEGRLKEAEPLLLRAVKTRPPLHMSLAQLYARRGDKDSAAREARQAADYFHRRAEADPNDHVARVHWADALAFLEQFPEAVAVLEKGWKLTGEPVYRTALAGACVVWSDYMARDPKASVADRLQLIQRGLAYDPASKGLLDRLLAMTRTDGPDADKARAALIHMAATGQAPAMAHFALGLDAWEHGRADEARTHWERAHELAPQVPAVANNLAWLLAESKPPDLTRALGLANLALEGTPNNAGFRDTRGRILARLGRWKEALPDLEAAVAASPNDAGLHGVLADVYRHLNVPDMADEHQRLAEKKPPVKATPPGPKP